MAAKKKAGKPGSGERSGAAAKAGAATKLGRAKKPGGDIGGEGRVRRDAAVSRARAETSARGTQRKTQRPEGAHKLEAAKAPAETGKSHGRRDAAGSRARGETSAAGSRERAETSAAGSRERAETSAAGSRERRATVGRPGKQAKVAGGLTESTEERIKEAARKLFTQNGFAATRTRDIAREAGINLALLNYYFRSKQKLFDLVMMENFRKFLSGMTVNFQDATLSMENRLERIVTAYVDFLNEFPDLPLFVLNEIRGNPSKIAEQVRQEIGPARSAFFKELQEAKIQGRIELDPFHFIANLVGLTVFPFVARPLLQRVTGVSDEQFLQFMEERKKLVPMWIQMTLKMKIPTGPGAEK